MTQKRVVKIRPYSVMKDAISGLEVIMNEPSARAVTVFSKNGRRVRVSRVLYKRGRNDIRYGALLLNFGRPNYREREYLAQCKRAKVKPYLIKIWTKGKEK